MNTTDFLTISAAICPERDCIVFEGRRQSFAQTNERANRLASALAGLGIGQNDIVAILQVNCPQYIEAYFAIARLGAIMVPLNFRAKPEELVYMLGNAVAKALLVGSRYVEMARVMLPQLATVQHIIAIDDRQPDMLCYEDLVSTAAPVTWFAPLAIVLRC
ncbi:MAG: AMP-binding protein [Chloroflexi bacterium]|nr:AMP-binding protein [Chloroflexota bacterium]